MREVTGIGSAYNPFGWHPGWAGARVGPFGGSPRYAIAMSIPTSRRTLIGTILSAASWPRSMRAAAPVAEIDPVATGAGRSPGQGGERGSISLTAFGYRGDGIADDTAAWQRAIAFAGANGIRTILVPGGISRVDGSIVDADHPLPPGLGFVGEGARRDTSYAAANRLRYTGIGVCWNVAYPTGGPESTGRWSWEQLTFQCSDPAGTMFSFNNPLTHTPSDDPAASRYMYLLHLDFRGVLAIGGSGTGDFIRAAKTFHLTIDDQSAVYGWRRGLWGRGCDNWRISCRMAANNRSVMLEAVNTLGNNNVIDTAFVESVDQEFGGELAYSIWDAGSYTTIRAGGLFEGKGGAAHLYLNGLGTAVEGPRFSFDLPLWQLGPDAREVVMTSPRISTFDLRWAPLFDVPASWCFGAAQSDHRMTIADVPQNVQRLLALSDQRGRVRLVDSSSLGGGLYQAAPAAVATSRGLLPILTCQAANGGFISYGSIGGKPIEGIVRDDGASGGYAAKLAAVPGSGVGLLFVVGRSLMPAIYRVHTRTRLAGGSDEILYVATRNGTFLRFLTLNRTPRYDRPVPDTLDLTGCVPGDRIGIEMYCRGGRANLFLDYISLVPVAD